MYFIQLFRCLKKGRNPVLEILPERAIVDGSVFDELNQAKWFVNNNGYVRRKVNNGGSTVNYAMHAEVMRINGISQPGPEYTVDHIDGNKLDNRLRNLRWANREQQGVNTVLRRNLPRGVTKRGKKYVAQLTSRTKKVHIYIGTFSTPEDASIAFENVWLAINPELAQFRRDSNLPT
jgi:hypothetical protein